MTCMNSIIVLMKNKALVVVVVLLVLLVGGYGAYRVYKHFARLAAPAGSQTLTSGQGSSPVSSLKDLLTNGVAQSCTFSTAESNGTVYSSSGKVRGDFDVTTDGQTMKSHMIVMNNTSYIWTDGQTTGFKMSFDPNATPVAGSTTGSTTPNGGFDVNANNNYKCGTWIADTSMFTLPEGINFSTFALPSVPTQTAPKAGTSSESTSPSSQCSYCDALTGSDKTQCLKALNCP